MIIISLTTWYVLFAICTTRFAHLPRRLVGWLCAITGVCIEVWFTWDMYRILYAKVIALCPAL